jgi:hypothetical protein
MKRTRLDDDPRSRKTPRRQLERGAAMTHFLNTLCVCTLFYASVTRGGVGVARILERLLRSKPA